MNHLLQLHASFESDVTLTVWNKKRLVSKDLFEQLNDVTVIKCLTTIRFCCFDSQIYSPTGTLTDYDDVRSVADAATKAVHK